MIGIIYRPIITEKMTKIQEKGCYSFEVDPAANKIQIAEAVSKKFNVSVTRVRTINVKPKTKAQMTRRGKFTGKTRHFKKAIVTLREGQKIDLFENI